MDAVVCRELYYINRNQLKIQADDELWKTRVLLD